MTPREKQLFDFIERRTRGGRRGPTFEEMREHIGVASKATVSRILASLQRQGLVLKPGNRTRAISLTRVAPSPALAAFTIGELRTEIAAREARA